MTEYVPHKLNPIGNLTDNHRFWKTVKTLFSDKVQVSSSITLIEDGRMVSQDLEIAENTNHYFVNITDSLGISTNESILIPVNDTLDPIDKAIRKFRLYPSICKIKESSKTSYKFEFRKVAIDDVAIQIRKLNPREASPIHCIPTIILKENSDMFCPEMQDVLNSGLSMSTFPQELKAGGINSIFKKGVHV